MDLKGFVNFLISTLITPFISLMLGAAIVFFMWNILGILKHSDQPEELAKMKQQAMWGIIAIAVMVSMWGLIYFFTSSANLNNNQLQLTQFNQY